jgi:hypothetical protein
VGEWYHIVVSKSDSNIIFYGNGVADTPDANNIVGPFDYISKAYIGGQGPFGFNFNGTIDEVVIWNRALSAAEVSELYNTSAGEYTYPNQDLGCSLNNSNDGDDDSVKGIINWYQDGQSIAVLNMPFESLTSNHPAINNSDMVGAWYFEGDAKDRTANGNDGIVLNDSFLVDGKVGQGYEFDGVNDFINISHSASLNITGPLTISFWMKAKTLVGDDAFFVSKSNNSHKMFGAPRSKVYEIGILNGWFYFAIGNGQWAPMIRENASRIIDGGWHHITATWNGSAGAGSMLMYFDGAEVDEDFETAPPAPFANIQGIHSSLAIGGYRDIAVDNADFNGTMDEVIIWNRSLSASEIQAVYKEGLNSKKEAKDYSGYQNTGTVINATYNATAGYDGWGAYEFDGKDDYIKI